ncbi:adhesion G-protein coupled receptor G6 isoform X2 [Megalops cyprinoides]|uniref:adhesion G-protein coupled receptor G6 isoform X2 n=1 Tax=Megalops cyprinoides TaxID=118141 RepID=UPI001863B126|nr:adhesion G-protein coupled receptor G6 isoform X2 [Megalops cyprinoides]
MLSYISGRWWRWKFRNVLSVALLLMCLRTSAVLSCQVDCNQVLTAPQGSFTSPCYPSDYPKSLACKWTLQAPAGFIVQITFVDFELEEALGCIYDRVVVSTGNNDLKFCGITAHRLTLNSTGNVMEVSFNSDFSVQKKGFNVSYRQVAVALRNQKVKVPQGNGKIIQAAPSVTIPNLQQFTACFEISRSSQKTKEKIFSYTGADDTDIVVFGMSDTEMALNINEIECGLGTILSPSDITAGMKPLCVTWASTSGRVAVYTNNNYRTMACTDSRGKLLAGAGIFKIGGKPNSFDGELYNVRLWDYAMSGSQLMALTCDALGNIIDWENAFWDIPSSVAQTDSTLSCSTATPTLTSVTSSCVSSGLGCPEGLFYRVSFIIKDTLARELEVERTVTFWLNQTFQNWTYAVYVIDVSVQLANSDSQSGQSSSQRYTCQALLMYKYATDVLLQETAIENRLTNQTIGNGLVLANVDVQPVENCVAEESPLHYNWPESRPTVTQFVPCFPNKAQNASRTCSLNLQNYTSFWESPDFGNCTDIDGIEVSAENAADVATQLADITQNELSTNEVSKVVTKLKEIVNVAKINASLASTMVTIFSNVMTSSDTALAATSELALKTVDEMVLKIVFEGPSLSITSKNLALGISAFNSTDFNGTSFSAFMAPNTTDLQIDFESGQQDPLAAVTLPATLLSNLSDTEAELISRINFMFFSKIGLFQDHKPSGLNLSSYVVASSVGNQSIKNLRDPVEIEIVHLQYQPAPRPVCVFWDFSIKNGTGGWSKEGCTVSPNSNGNKTICLCDHLTHFGILMDISGSADKIDAQNTKILTFITYIGCGISAIFSAATLLTYIAFEKLRRDYPSKILMNLSTSLLFLNMVFLLDGWLASFDKQGLCIAVAVFLHFFLLTSFTWMGLESIHMYIALVKVFNTYIRRYILKFCIVGWGLPATIVAIVVAVDRNSYGKEYYGKEENGQGSSEFCWIKSHVVFYVTCVGYFCIIFLMNVAMFIVVMIQICGRNGKRSNRTLREEMLRNLRSVVSLTFLLGMTWGFAFFAWGPVNLAFMYLFSIFNSLQGLFIFIFHCALKENVQKQWRRYLCCGRFRLADNSDWSKTATNNTKKVSSDNLGKSLSSSSFGSSTVNWTSKAKATLNPFAKRGSNAGKGYSSQSSPKFGPSDGDASSSIIPVHQVIDKVKGYCSVRSDNFYKNIIMSDSFSHSTKF